uniref:NAD(+) kinase n=1 Tax=Syphacia muris TaxID=451379 RepID=A0A0N5ATU8_9BILA
MVVGSANLISQADILDHQPTTEDTSDVGIFRPKRVLLLCKTSRLDYEHKKYADLSEEQFRSVVSFMNQKGSNYERMRRKHMLQQIYFVRLRTVLKSKGIEVRAVKMEDYTDEAVAWADAVFTAGGDGTFLIAASKVRDHKPVIGFNTDPIGSEGHLCITRKANLPINDVINKLLSGQFSFTWRQRIRVSVLKWAENRATVSENEEEMTEKSDELRNASLYGDTNTFDPKVPVLALNDVFVGESHAARVSTYEIQIDDGAVLKQKSSGLVVSTGTGSTSWNYNINRIFEQDVNDLMRIMSSLGARFNDTSKTFTRQVCQRFNEKLIFSPQSQLLAYSVREPLVNATYPENIKRGFASRIWIRSCCSDAQLILDGGFSIPFNYGTEILLEIHKEDSLCTVMLV